MTDAFTSMKTALDRLCLYDIKDNNIYCELMAYALVLDEINSDLCKMKDECFIDTANSYGLSQRELLIGAVRDDLNLSKRREMLTLRERINSGCFTVEKIKESLKSFGLECELYEYPSLYTVIINAIGRYTKEQQAWIRAQVHKIIPAHLQVQVMFDGPSWSEIDRNNNTFAYMDTLDMTWEDIDNLN